MVDELELRHDDTERGEENEIFCTWELEVSKQLLCVFFIKRFEKRER